MKDMLEELTQALVSDEEIQAIQNAEGLKSYLRYDGLADELTSITLIPSGTPEQTGLASNTSLSKHFIYQVSIEATDRKVCKKLQRKVETILETKGFYQMSAGLDEYFTETKRYVDARFYQGNSNLYDNY